MEKVAVPFWLCWTAGMVVALATGHFALWLVLGAAVGLVVGFILRANASRRKRESFHSKAKVSASSTAAVVPAPPAEGDRAA